MSRRYYAKYVVYVETHAADSHTDEEIQVDLYVLMKLLQRVKMPFNIHRMQPLVSMEPIAGGKMKPVSRWYYLCKAYRKWQHDHPTWKEKKLWLKWMLKR